MYMLRYHNSTLNGVIMFPLAGLLRSRWVGRHDFRNPNTNRPPEDCL
jgi:hypothetical protein